MRKKLKRIRQVMINTLSMKFDYNLRAEYAKALRAFYGVSAIHDIIAVTSDIVSASWFETIKKRLWYYCSLYKF